MPTQTKSNPIDESVEAATERVAELNEKVVELNEKAVANGRKAGAAYLTSYERAVVALADLLPARRRCHQGRLDRRGGGHPRLTSRARSQKAYTKRTSATSSPPSCGLLVAAGAGRSPRAARHCRPARRKQGVSDRLARTLEDDLRHDARRRDAQQEAQGLGDVAASAASPPPGSESLTNSLMSVSTKPGQNATDLMPSPASSLFIARV